MKQLVCDSRSSATRFADVDHLAHTASPLDTKRFVQHFRVSDEQPLKGCLRAIVPQLQKSFDKDPMAQILVDPAKLRDRGIFRAGA